MGKLVVTEFVSLDGVMEAPGGEPGYAHSGWVFRFQSPDQAEFKFEEVLGHEAHILGRKTYETFAEAWPQRTGEFADRMNSMKKYVVSTTMKTADWNNTSVISSDVANEVARLKRETHGDLLVAGSRTLVNYLKQHDLVDEYRLMVFPIVLGSGMRLFEDAPDAYDLRLVGTRLFDAGTAVLIYERVRG